MLGYDQWGSTPHSPDPPNLILADHHHHHQDHHDHHAIINHNQTQTHHHRPMFDDPFTTPCTFPHPNNPPSSSSFYNFPQQQQFPLYDNDPRAFPSASSYHHHQQQQQQQQYPLSLQDSNGALAVPTGSGYPVLVPKAEPEYANRIGLNLGGRTYFAAADDDLVSRLYRRSRAAEPVNTPKCQAEGCNADLSHAKHYHRRHKVCEFHSKAATVIAAGLTQRFCQQCSRFHLLSEFDNGKRSCRKRLADHNRRRRKSNQSTNREHSAYSMSENAHNSSPQSIQRSPSDSGANSSSSVTVAISSPRVSSFDSSFRQRSYE